MKGCLGFDISRHFKKLLLLPTSSLRVQALRSLVVGGIVFLVDAGILWLLYIVGLHYLICAVFSFIIAVMLNYFLSIHFIFFETAKFKRLGEIATYFAVSLVGLALTVGLMWLFTELVGLFFMLSKVIATLLSFIWNFTARKMILYRETFE